MQVIDHEPGAWFFLQEDDDYFRDVLCDRGMVSFSTTIKLTDEETALYHSGGRDYIMELGDEITYRSDPLDPRHLRDQALQERIHAAIVARNKSH